MNQAGTTTGVASTASTSIYGGSVTFTATVTSGATGTVTFLDGTTTLGTGTINNGQATYSTPGLAAGSHSITAVYAGDTNYTGSTSSAVSQTVNQANLTITAMNQTKTYGFGGIGSSLGIAGFSKGSLYNADTISAVTLSTNATVSGSGKYNAGTWALTPSAATGTGLANYNITYSAGSLTVNTASLTVSGITATSKLYDSTTVAVVKTTGAQLNGALAGDTVALAATNGTGVFSDKNVGTNKSIRIGGLSISGASAGNYTLVQPTITGNITPRNLTITLYANSKVYDGTTAVTLRLQDNRLPGDVLIPSYTSAAFTDKIVGTNKTVTIVGGSVTGPDAGNYKFTPFVSPITTTACITPKALEGTVTVANKVFDGNAYGTITARTLTGVVPGDMVSYLSKAGYEKASFADKHVGTDRTATALSLYLSGTDATNYMVNSVATTTANISPFALTVTATGTRREYDGSMDATVTLKCNSVPGSTLTLSYASAKFSDKNAGLVKAVSVTGIQLSGADALDYSFNSTASATSMITTRKLTITATAANKKYDGTTTASVTLSDNRITGDQITLSYAAAAFASAAIGNGKTVTVTGISATGNDAANYDFVTVVTTKANITA